MTSSLRVQYGDQVWQPDPARPFTIGRDGDVALDSNMHLHRRFLQIDHRAELWWLSNVGTALSATVADDGGLMQAWLAPGGRLPLVFDRTAIWFTAGTTTYDLVVLLGEPVFAASDERGADGTTLRKSLTRDQRLMLVALAEPLLRKDAIGQAEVPTARYVAERLGWSMAKLDQNFEHVCQKLAGFGVRGLQEGDPQPEPRRRARVLEYAMSSRLVGPDDLGVLDHGARVPVRGTTT